MIIPSHVFPTGAHTAQPVGVAGDVWQTLEGEYPGTDEEASVSETRLILAHSLPPRILQEKLKHLR